MSNKERIPSLREAVEITLYLLRKGVRQKAIAVAVGRSQSWVSRVKKELAAYMRGRQDGQRETMAAMVDGVVDRLAGKLSQQMEAESFAAFNRGMEESSLFLDPPEDPD